LILCDYLVLKPEAYCGDNSPVWSSLKRLESRFHPEYMENYYFKEPKSDHVC